MTVPLYIRSLAGARSVDGGRKGLARARRAHRMVQKMARRYGVEQALDEAMEILRSRFGEVDQQAAVDLAGLLYSTRERDRFLEEHPQEPGAVYP